MHQKTQRDLNLVPSVLPPILKAKKALTGEKQVTHSTNLAKHDVYNLRTQMFFFMNCCELRNRDVMKEEFLPKVIIELLKFVGDSSGFLSFREAKRVSDDSWKIYYSRTYQENKQL